VKRRAASLTATKIARVVVYLGRHPRYAGVLPEGCAEWSERVLEAAGLLADWQRRVIGSKWMDRTLTAVQRVTVPGMALHVGLRKRYMEDAVRDALAAGATQVLVLGAGFDTLCLRLAPQYPDVHFVEVDHPATHARKVEAVRKLDAEQANLQFIAADLGKHMLEEVLTDEHGWSDTEKSIAVAEGLLMYLSQEEVRLFLSSCATALTPGSEVAISFLRRGADDRIHLGGVGMLTALSLRAIGEPIRWGVQKGGLERLLESLGFAVVDAPSSGDLRARYLASAGLATEPLGDVEHLARAKLGQAPRAAGIRKADGHGP